ncbi:MAG: twin-arginine translocation signal domain-containing protein [Solirubrobacterales bacterium]|nr:twin-arginine translocation signal domain-containing protein [Solirubrobacterales bacterium]MBV9166715.1 twin-arginine translocation signal domain-containing protein [Solirubrobacterales bacterium]MBV9535456.1 twin-arginine translocation signal domain-containing protein [Solirubrobacterales bacterium]
MTQRLVEAAGSLVQRRTSRRGLLARAALAGSAMVVAPWRFLTRPVSAMEVIGPGNCPSGSLCANGYSAFCCQVNHGANRCPSGTFIGGWWMCTAYSGGGVCASEGVRYYVDCNCLPGHSCGGCRCAHGTCNEMRIDCNVFRYGQCNTQIGGITPVYCRVVVCQNPARIDGFNCSSSVAVDDNVCSQTADCLTPLVQQVPADGGV